VPASFRTEKGILFVTITGHRTLHPVLAALADSVEITKERGIRRVLVDIRNAGLHVSTNDIFQFASSLVDVCSRDTRPAIVFSPETYAPEDARFTENVAVNRGVLLKTFTELSDARDWLLAEER
jgi:hypothetical protein